MSLNMADVVESDCALRRLDRADTRVFLRACLEQLHVLMQDSHGEARKWP